MTSHGLSRSDSDSTQKSCPSGAPTRRATACAAVRPGRTRTGTSFQRGSAATSRTAAAIANTPGSPDETTATRRPVLGQVRGRTRRAPPRPCCRRRAGAGGGWPGPGPGRGRSRRGRRPRRARRAASGVGQSPAGRVRARRRRPHRRRRRAAPIAAPTRLLVHAARQQREGEVRHRRPGRRRTTAATRCRSVVARSTYQASSSRPARRGRRARRRRCGPAS